MSKINENVFTEGKKFVDISGLSHFWTKTKEYVDSADENISAKVKANEDKLVLIQNELDGLSGGSGSITTQIETAINNLNLPNTYATKGELNAEIERVDDLESELGERISSLELINHEKLASDAAAAAVAGVIDGAPEKFDTLKEIAAWIADANTADDAASLVTRVAALEEIDHDAYVSYVDGKVDGKFDTVGSAAAAQSAAIAQAKVDAAEALKAYYTKTEVDSLLSSNSTGDRAYAKQYTDELFGSMTFAVNSDIDLLFS